MFLKKDLFSAIIILGIICTGCKESDTTAPELETTTFEDVIESGGEFEDPVPSEQTLSVEDSVEERADGSTWICTRTTYSVTEAPENFPNFNPNAEILYPGNLLQGKTLGWASPEPVVVNRAPGTIVMTILTGSGGSYQVDVDEISLGNVIQAQNDILAQNDGPVPANFTFNIHEVNSREQLGLELDVNYESLFSEIDASLSFSSDQSYNRFLVTLNQSYYTMAFELPVSVDDVFAPDVTPDQLAKYIYPGNPGAYISSITYGRIFYMLVESTESKESMEASISGSFNSALSGTEMEGGVSYVSDLEDVKIKAYALGGDAGLAINAVAGGFDQLTAYLAEGGDINTGIALSYNMRALSNNMRVKSKVATEYDVVDCYPVAINNEHELLWFRADSLVSTDSNGDPVYWGNAFNNDIDATLTVFSPGLVPNPQLVQNVANGHPAMKFHDFSPAEVGPHFQYDGGVLINTNYTIFIVAKAEVQWGESCYFMFSSYFLSENESLWVGYREHNAFTMEHWGTALDINTTNNDGQFELYTLRFNMNEGMSIWKNGMHRGTDPTLTEPLTNYPYASIGMHALNTPYGAPAHGYVAEIRGYGTAMDEEERTTIEEILMRKYALGPFGD